MAKRKVFYSFHYDNDVFRVQQIRNIGALEANEPVSANTWEQIKRGGDTAIKRWINENMEFKSCLVVLIGSETASRKWVKYEIEKAWNDNRAVLGVYIHNINCMRSGTCYKGPNPFDDIYFKDGSRLSSAVKAYNPNPNNAYADIANNLEYWIEEAIASR
jgi:MTH538 TIR-like domain (DUF1863)